MTTAYGMSRRSAVGGGVFLLLYEVLGLYGSDILPKMTLVAVAFMTGIHLELIPHLGTPIPLNPMAVINGDWQGLLLGPLFHGDDIHLYYNMASLIWKGRNLERKYGALNFGLLLIFLTLGTSITFVGLSYLVTDFLDDPSYLHTRAIGFSGVLFALKVIGGERNPFSFGTWAELILIQLAVPNASFLGHLAGLLFGICYAFNPFTSLVANAKKSLSKYHVLAIAIALISTADTYHSHSSPALFDTLKNLFSSSRNCISSGTRHWSTFISGPLRYRDPLDYLLLFISIPIKLSLLESFRGAPKAWLCALVALFGTPITYYLSTCYLRLEKIPFLVDECVYGITGPLFALKTAVLCIMLFGGVDAMHLLFELVEAYVLLLRGSYHLYHLSGALLGLALYAFLRSQRRYDVFSGTGRRLGGSSPSSDRQPTVRSSRATRSWGYGGYDRDSVVRRRVKKKEIYIDPLVLNDSLQSSFEEENEEVIMMPIPSAPAPSYPSSLNPPPPPPLYPSSLDPPPPPPSFQSWNNPLPSAPSEEEVMDVEYEEEDACNINDVREKRINKFG